MTESEHIAWHVQSYFLVFEHKALATPDFHAFWDAFRFHLRKVSIIRHGEVRLSQEARRRGWRVGAFVDGAAVRTAARKEPGFQYGAELDSPVFNATLLAWDLLLRDFGFPFLKTEVLRQDRFGSAKLASYRDLVRTAGPDYDLGLIERSRNARALAEERGASTA
jgi:hypothetical protein